MFFDTLNRWGDKIQNSDRLNRWVGKIPFAGALSTLRGYGEHLVSGLRNNASTPAVNGGSYTATTPSETPQTTVPTPGETYADTVRQDALDKAGVDYLAAVTDAENRYKIRTNPYGATAERMAAAGLQNTGYAGYLTDRAYASKVDEVLAAKAQKSAAERAAETEYAAYLRDEALRKEEESENKAQAFASTGDFVGAAGSLVSAGTLTPEEAANMIFSGYKAQIDNGGIDIDSVEREHSSGDIDDATYNSIRQYWSNSFIVDDAIFSGGEEGSVLTAAAAKALYNRAMKWLSPDKKEALTALYEKRYVAHVADGVTLQRNMNIAGKMKDGTSLIFADDQGHRYFVQIAGKASTDAYFSEATKEIKSGVFLYDGEMYFKHKNGTVYKLKKEGITDSVNMFGLDDLRSKITTGSTRPSFREKAVNSFENGWQVGSSIGNALYDFVFR